MNGEAACGLAREAAGLSIGDAARKARISIAYLRQVERGGAPYRLARRLARLYGCSANVFIKRRQRQSEEVKLARHANGVNTTAN